MANPDPQALRDAAASLRDQAKAARDTAVNQYRQIETERKEQYDHATTGLDVAKTELKSHEANLARRQQQLGEARATVDKLHQGALDADKAGDSAKATELREAEAYNRADLDSLSTNADRAQQEVNQSRVAVAQAENDMANAEQRFTQVHNDFSAAETQLDAMENKAKLLENAGLKLGLAATMDNPVERADAELAAEKVLKDANAIAIDTGPITRITGQDLQVPDVNALPPMATPGDGSTPAGGSTSPTDTTPAGAGTDTTPGTDGAGSAEGAGGDSSSLGAPPSDTTPTSDATTPGHLQDDFATVAAGADGTGDPLGAAPDPGPASDSTVAPDLTAAADPLGVDAAAPVTADASAGSDPAAAAADPGSDGGGFGDTGFDTSADQTVAAADPMPDASAAPADSFNDFSADPSAGDATVSVGDDADA